MLETMFFSHSLTGQNQELAAKKLQELQNEGWQLAYEQFVEVDREYGGDTHYYARLTREDMPPPEFSDKAKALLPTLYQTVTAQNNNPTPDLTCSHCGDMYDCDVCNNGDDIANDDIPFIGDMMQRALTLATDTPQACFNCGTLTDSRNYRDNGFGTWYVLCGGCETNPNSW